MKRFALLCCLSSFILAALFAGQWAAPEAQAADVWKFTLTSSDAGPTGTVALEKHRIYSIQCAIPACYKTATSGTVVPDCTKDYTLIVSPSSREFNSAGHAAIAAVALDGGNPACKVLQVTQNP